MTKHKAMPSSSNLPPSKRQKSLPVYDFISPKNQEHIEFIADSRVFFNRLTQDLQQACKEILLEFYIFALDTWGQKILRILEKKTTQGVRIYLTVDAIGSFSSLALLRSWAKDHHISLQVFNPWLKYLNKRNHRKLVIIDNAIIYSGSFNITRTHEEWADCAIRYWAQESMANYVREEFFKVHSQTKWWSGVVPFNPGLLSHPQAPSVSPSWYRRWWSQKWKVNKTSSGAERVFFPDSWPMRGRWFFNRSVFQRLNLMRLIYRACLLSQREIFLASPYFLPRSFFLRALMLAAQKDVQVNILIPQKTDVWPVLLASFWLTQRLLKRGVKVWIYQPRVWHAKFLMIDDVLLIGSHNWNHRSFLHDLEILLATKKQWLDLPGNINSWGQYIQEILSQSRPAQEAYANLNWLEKFLARFFYWFRYWM